mmetsp:Transcript_16109/g.18246  ORF Transcript_16109/g.18246 Transcript_16109/m.18246 type:complete len:365 (+) Transcript_16109:247-1341(+)
MACETDFDCPGTQICYSNVGWSDADPFCECSSWYGWTGFPECGSLGPHAKLALFIHICEAFVCFCFLLATSRDLSFILRSRNITRSKSTTYFSLLFSSSGILFYFIWKLTDIALISTPEKNTAEIAGDDEKYHQFVVVKRVFIVLTVICLIFSTLHISLMWLEIAHSTDNFVIGRNAKFQTYKRKVFVIECVYCLILSITAGLGYFYLIVVIAFPFIFGTGISYTIGYVRLRKLIRANIAETSMENTNQRAHFLKVILSVKKTTEGVVLAVYLMLASGLVYSILILLDWRQFSPVNKISMIYLINEIFIFAILWALSIVWIFSHNSFHGFSNSYSRSSQLMSASDSKTPTSIRAEPSLEDNQSL